MQAVSTEGRHVREVDIFQDPFADDEEEENLHAAPAAAANGHGAGLQHSSDSGFDAPHSIGWLIACSIGIMASFIVYGVLMEYATTEGRKLHEMSLIFVTSLLYTVAAYFGRYVRGEEPTTIPKHQMVVLGCTSMGSTFTSVRSLRYVIYPVQVLAKSCKPIPVMLMGALMGKQYPVKKYVNVTMIVSGVALFMYSGDGSGKPNAGSGGQALGLLLLFFSLCCDGGTGAYEDKLMKKHHVGPFDLMFNIQFAKTLLSGVGLIISGQINLFFRMVADTGVILLLLGLSGAIGQVFIFVTISKFGALTCSIIGLARKILTLVASLVIYRHPVNAMQGVGLTLAIGAMAFNFRDKGSKPKKAEQPLGTAAAAAVAPLAPSSSSSATGFVADAVRTARAAFERHYFSLSSRQRQSRNNGESDAPDAVELKPLMADDDDEEDVDDASALTSAQGATRVLV